MLGEPELEISVSDLAERLGTPYASVHREIERAEAVGLIASRRVGRTRLVRADTTSPYYAGLADVLTRAFGPPRLLTSFHDTVVSRPMVELALSAQGSGDGADSG